MEDLLIFPYSGTAIEALDCLDDNWNCRGFISDDEAVIGKDYFGIKVYGREAFETFSDAKVLAVHGSPTSFLKREAILNSLGLTNKNFGKVIHPKACISPLAKLGDNVLIMAGVVITANAIIGD